MERWESNGLTLSPGGRGWPAAGAFISRGGPGEGVREYVAEFMKQLTKSGYGEVQRAQP